VTMSALGAIVLYIMSLLSLFRLRRREPGLDRPFHTPAYPLFPLIALAIALVSLVAIVWYNPLLSAIFLATGLVGAAITMLRFRQGKIVADEGLLTPAAAPSDGQSVSR
ncbi:MAG: ethanolamine permease, partial [Proteobacteria bacterium]|nr:ethanolamine permease [Pseudomonadota bacterium]